MIWPLSETEGALACRKYIGMQEILLLYCNLKTKISLKHTVMLVSRIHGQRHIRLIILHNYFSSFATHVIGEGFRIIRHGNNVLNVLYKTVFNIHTT